LVAVVKQGIRIRELLE
ncbi:hypothetical protein MTO96_043375, partial [Rhipicephalus appendiculatus]